MATANKYKSWLVDCDLLGDAGKKKFTYLRHLQGNQVLAVNIDPKLASGVNWTSKSRQGYMSYAAIDRDHQIDDVTDAIANKKYSPDETYRRWVEVIPENGAIVLHEEPYADD